MAELFPDDDAQDAPPILSKKGLAQLLDVSPSRISQLIVKGLPVRPDGKLDRAAALAWYERNIDPNRRRAMLDAVPADTRRSADPRRDLARIKADTAALELAKAQGKLVSRAAAEKVVFERARLERDAHLSWVARVAPELAGELDADPAATFSVLDRLMRAHLAQLSDTPLEGLTDDA